MATISTHNGSQAHRDHNLRGHSTDKQDHIKKDGVHEVWIDEAPREAYNRIFGEALERYNAKQTREERKINNYYNHIQQDGKKHPVYEMIIGVYGDVPEDASKQIMREFVDRWQQRNPNLELIGAYYHADEEGQPHVHIDYVPVADGYTKGMSIQNSISKALEQQGFSKQGRATAQIQWEQRENQALEDICNQYGISVEHPQRNKGAYHLHTDTFKAKKELDTIKAEINASEGELEAINDKVRKLGSVPIRKVDKHILGKEKETVTMPKDEYNNLWIMANVVEDLNSTSKRLEEKQKELDEYKNTLEAEKSKFDEIRARFEREKSDAEDNIENAPKYKQKIRRLKADKDELSFTVNELRNEINELKEDLDDMKEHRDILASSNVELHKQAREQEEELSFFRSAFGRVKEWVLEKFKWIKEAEEVLKDPECKVSQVNKNYHDMGVNKYGPFATVIDNKYYYGCSDYDGYISRNAFIVKRYMNAVTDVEKEIGSSAFADADIIAEGKGLIAKANERSHSRGHSR